MQARQQLLYRGILVVLERLSSVYGHDSVPHVTTVADDRYIVLHHLRNRRLTASATGGQYGIHPQTVTNRLVQPIRTYRPYIGQILTRRHRTARQDWCRRHQGLYSPNYSQEHSLSFSPRFTHLNVTQLLIG